MISSDGPSRKAWLSEHMRWRIHAAPVIRHPFIVFHRLFDADAPEGWRELTAWYQHTGRIKTRLGVRAKILMAAPWGPCYGFAALIVQRLQANPKETLRRILSQWPDYEQAVVRLSVGEVFRHAVEVADGKQDIVLPRLWLEQLYARPAVTVTILHDHVATLKQSLEGFEEVAIILRSWRRGSRIGHAYLFHLSSLQQQFAFFNTTRGYGLFEFESAAEFWKSISAYFRGRWTRGFDNTVWRLEIFNLHPSHLENRL